MIDANKDKECERDHKDAEKWNTSVLANGYSLTKAYQIVERLKKRIEQLENVYPVLKNSTFDVHLIDSPSQTNLKVRKMLQKILDGDAK